MATGWVPGYTMTGGTPSDVRFGHYSVAGKLIAELPHTDGVFTEPVHVAAGEMIVAGIPASGATLVRVDQLHRA